jgi:hypothetical protein
MSCIMGKKKQQKRAKATAKVDADEAAFLASLQADAGGYDWGWPATDMAAANMELIRRLSAGGFTGCGYGFWGETEGPPFISLMGTNLAGMKSAMALIQEWSKAVGPNALQLEILFDGAGYVISLSQQPELLRLRLTGLDTANQPMLITTSISKPLDTRQPFLDDLAKYSNEPVAPVILTVAEQSVSRRGEPINTVRFRPQTADAILLPGVNIYQRLADRPAFSMVRARGEGPPDMGGPPEPDRSPEALSRQRQRRLKAALPKTLHVLRHREDGKALIEKVTALGCAPWQAEQAVCNLRVPDFLAYQPNGKVKRLSMLDKIRSVIVEPASTTFKADAIDVAAVVEQVTLDTAFLVRRLDKGSKVDGDLASLNARLQELGHG